MPVTHVHSDAEFRTILNNNNSNSTAATGDKLFLVDYSATWCGPCQQIAPLFKQLSDKHSHANFQFIHVDVDECGEVSQEQGIRALPTFVFYKNTTSTELARLQGANPSALESKIAELAPQYKPYFGGEGNKLGGGSSSTTTPKVTGSSTSLSADEIQSIAQSKIEYSSTGSAKIGFRFMPTIQGGPLSGVKPTLRINGTDRVSRMREFIDELLQLSGTSSSGSYEFHNSYPPGKLDELKTVADSGVAGSVVVVKFQ